MFLQSIWLSEMHKPPTHEHYLLSVISILNESIPAPDLSICVLSGNTRGNKLCPYLQYNLATSMSSCSLRVYFSLEQTNPNQEWHYKKVRVLQVVECRRVSYFSVRWGCRIDFSEGLNYECQLQKLQDCQASSVNLSSAWGFPNHLKQKRSELEKSNTFWNNRLYSFWSGCCSITQTANVHTIRSNSLKRT